MGEQRRENKKEGSKESEFKDQLLTFMITGLYYRIKELEPWRDLFFANLFPG